VQTALNPECAEVGFVRGNEEQLLTLRSIQSPFAVSLSRHVTAVAEARSRAMRHLADRS
jgi:hypothetical protein